MYIFLSVCKHIICTKRFPYDIYLKMCFMPLFPVNVGINVVFVIVDVGNDIYVPFCH